MSKLLYRDKQRGRGFGRGADRGGERAQHLLDRRVLAALHLNDALTNLKDALTNLPMGKPGYRREVVSRQPGGVRWGYRRMAIERRLYWTFEP